MSTMTLLVNEEQEFDDMGSYNHSLVQANLAYLLRVHSPYSAFIELSLDASKLDKIQFPGIKNELIPDVCAYPRDSVKDLDILVMHKMPILVIEVVSPRQGIQIIVEKIQAYFALGIASCWLVEPLTKVVRLYRPDKSPQTIVSGEIIDEVANLRLPIAEVFG